MPAEPADTPPGGGRRAGRRRLAGLAAAAVLDAFDRYSAAFEAVTARARRRFETRDWSGGRRDDVERLDLYEAALDAVTASLKAMLGGGWRERSLWTAARETFGGLVTGRHDAEPASTFFNSVTRRIFLTVGIARDIEFFRWDPLPSPPLDEPVETTWVSRGDTVELIRDVLASHAFDAPFEDLQRDAVRVAREVDLHVWPFTGYTHDFALDVLRAPFFRNTTAYLIGRIRAGGAVLPFALPLRHGDGGVYADGVLLCEAEVSIVFSFAFSYFHVEIRRHDAVIGFLRSILPEKPVAELSISLGFNRHGRTEFYRDLHRHIHRVGEPFVIAPGREGAMMIAFTLAHYDFVFKVIKDRPCFLRSPGPAPKSGTRADVMACYDFVAHRDRAGRMVDTQEFVNLRFRKRRFAPELLDELRRAGRTSVSEDDTHVVIRHVYVQRKVQPLPLYLVEEDDPEAIRHIVLDFGRFLGDLSATGIFPGDLFNLWNYGVTRRRRVVLFDYDDVMPIERVRFLEKPRPTSDADELVAEEDRIVAGPADFFMDEIRRYSGLPRPLRGIFEAAHAELFTVEFWRTAQRRVAEGLPADVVPYEERRRFPRP